MCRRHAGRGQESSEQLRMARGWRGRVAESFVTEIAEEQQIDDDVDDQHLHAKHPPHAHGGDDMPFTRRR